MTESPKPANNSGLDWLSSFVPPGTAALQASIQEWVDETQKASAAWMRRRQEATEASLRSIQSICASKDPAALSTACTDWLVKTADLVSADMRDAQEEAVRCAEIGQKWVKAALQFGTEAAKEVASKKETRSQAAPTRSAAE